MFVLVMGYVCRTIIVAVMQDTQIHLVIFPYVMEFWPMLVQFATLKMEHVLLPTIVYATQTTLAINARFLFVLELMLLLPLCAILAMEHALAQILAFVIKITLVQTAPYLFVTVLLLFQRLLVAQTVLVFEITLAFVNLDITAQLVNFTIAMVLCLTIL